MDRMSSEHMQRCIDRLRAEKVGQTREGRELIAALASALVKRAEK